MGAVQDGEASLTARGVAAYRSTFDRVPANYGDPEADQRLQLDVAAGLEPPPSNMTKYLRARTFFIDQAVVDAIRDGIRQVVSVGAGYDGRSLRYRAPGVRWFELDHPSTQADKKARLRRLEIPTAAVGFAAADFTRDDIGAALAAVGHDPTQRTLFTCEGVTAYLDLATIESLLTSLRAVAAPRGRFALEIPLVTDLPEDDDRRSTLTSTVGELGEPLLSSIPRDELEPFLSQVGWEIDRAADPRGVTLGAGARNTLFIHASPTA